ncbi:MAG: peptidyl-prolyl cis-trans isomerase [Betaproteobacteria bacterium]|nr:peptidyl-prolyl cis-trans isomerase [Betaproteobacteria bacterium]
MVAEASGCSGPAFRADSVPDLAVLTCKVTAAGPLTVNIRSANGALLFTQTLSVPLPKVLFVTSKGSFELELNPAVVPVTVDNFLGYVSRSFYSNTLFHRVVAGFVVQGGGFTAGLVDKEPKSASIALESNRGLSNTRSTVAMARTADPNSATSQFFVNVVDNVALDYQNADNPGYAVFGRVVSGMDVVDAIAAVPTATVGLSQNVPTADVTINLALQTR